MVKPFKLLRQRKLRTHLPARNQHHRGRGIAERFLNCHLISRGARFAFRCGAHAVRERGRALPQEARNNKYRHQHHHRNAQRSNELPHVFERWHKRPMMRAIDELVRKAREGGQKHHHAQKAQDNALDQG